MNTGEKLRFFAEQKFGQLSKLADALDMSASSLQKYLNNEREPGFGILRKLKNLDCDIDWLLSEESVVKETTIEYTASKLREENEALKKTLNKIKQIIEEEEKKYEQEP